MYWIKTCDEYLQHFASDKALVSDFARANNLPQIFNKFMSVGVAGWGHPNAKVKITKVAAEGLCGVCQALGLTPRFPKAKWGPCSGSRKWVPQA